MLKGNNQAQSCTLLDIRAYTLHLKANFDHSLQHLDDECLRTCWAGPGLQLRFLDDV
jgi:hypothetical protein